jgi:hypothetical protein
LRTAGFPSYRLNLGTLVALAKYDIGSAGGGFGANSFPAEIGNRFANRSVIFFQKS